MGGVERSEQRYKTLWRPFDKLCSCRHTEELGRFAPKLYKTTVLTCVIQSRELMLVPVVCSALPVQVFWMVVCQAPLVMSGKVSVHGGLKAYFKDM